MISKNNIIVKITSNDLSGHVNFCVDSKGKNDYSLVVYENDKEIYKNNGSFNDFTNISFFIDNPKIWSLNSPFLYRYVLKIQKKEISGTFGIRKISTKGKYIELNDIPIFVKGYIRGATAHEHNNNLNCSEEEFYRKNIKTAKSFGFNFVRFHSQIPSDIFFKVADEEGMLVHIEMRPPHDLYNNLEEMINTRNDFIKPEFIKEVVNRLYNHPSFAVYCLGNEIKNLSSSSIVEEIAKDIKNLDPTRLFIDTCAWGENNRPLVDIDVQHLSYYFPFGKHAGMYDDTSILKVGEFNKGKDIVFNVPLLAHEVCHYTALRDFTNLGIKFDKHNIARPWWINEELKMIKEKGFEEIYPSMYQASKEFQLACWKVAYEEMRSSKLLGGFHFLQFADTDVYENSNGVVDCFDDPNYITCDRFIDFNGDTVLLVKNNKYNYYDNQTIDLPLYISRFDENKFTNGTINYSLKSSSINIHKSINNVDISKHDFYQIGCLELPLPKLEIMEEATLTIELIVDEKIVSKNDYKLWIYPHKKQISYDELINYHHEDSYITDDIDKALSYLSNGKKVCLIYRSQFTRHVTNKTMEHPKYAFKATWNRHKPVIWDRGTNFGGLVDVNILGKYGYTKFYNHNFAILAEDADKIILEGILNNADNLIMGIDKCNRDRFDAYKGSFNLPELMYDRTLRNFSYLFEINVDKGKLLVCGFNLTNLDKNESSSNYLANVLIDYVNSNEFKPSKNINLNDLISYLLTNSKEPVKERMMTQFWELDDEPVESKKYWEESRKYLTEK